MHDPLFVYNLCQSLDGMLAYPFLQVLSTRYLGREIECPYQDLRPPE